MVGIWPMLEVTGYLKLD